MLPDPPRWKFLWERHRVRICQAGGLVLLVIAKPSRSNLVFGGGFLMALFGEAIRFWAAGHIRKSQQLAHEGPYAATRNPLYLGSFVMACGFAFICTSARHWLASAIVWGAVLSTFYWLYPEKIALEEADLASRFGLEFDAYRQRVPCFWPNLQNWNEARTTGEWNFRQAIRNKEHRTLWALLGLALLLRFKMISPF